MPTMWCSRSGRVTVQKNLVSAALGLPVCCTRCRSPIIIRGLSLSHKHQFLSRVSSGWMEEGRLLPAGPLGWPAASLDGAEELPRHGPRLTVQHLRAIGLSRSHVSYDLSAREGGQASASEILFQRCGPWQRPVSHSEVQLAAPWRRRRLMAAHCWLLRFF